MRKHLTKTSLLTGLFALAVVGAVYAAGSYGVISAPELGAVQPAGIDVGKVIALQVEGAVPVDGTFILSRISEDGSATNALLTRTAASGAIADTLGTGTNIWIMAGDRLLRSGTITNTCRIRIILADGP